VFQKNLTETKEELIYLPLHPIEIGPTIDPEYWANVSVHRHPWLATALTISLLMTLILLIMLCDFSEED
jgi:hypothetical protein